MLCKFRHFINVATNISIYHAIFHSHLPYVCTGWGQILNSKHRINLLQKKAMWIISFASFHAHVLPIFAEPKIIKFPDLISFCNCFFVYEDFMNKSFSVFSHVFILTSNTHKQNTRLASHCLLTKTSCNTSKYDKNDFAASAIISWNPTIQYNIQRKFSDSNLCQLYYSQLKMLIKNTFSILTMLQ